MLDRHRAVARVLGDVARDDVDQRRPILVAVPGNLAARLHDEPAHAKEAAGNLHLLLGQVDLPEQLLLDVLVSLSAGLLTIRGFLAGRTGGARRRGAEDDQSGERSGDRERKPNAVEV